MRKRERRETRIMTDLLGGGETIVPFLFRIQGHPRGIITRSPLYVFFFQAEDGIRDCLLSRGLGDVYKRQVW